MHTKSIAVGTVLEMAYERTLEVFFFMSRASR